MVRTPPLSITFTPEWPFLHDKNFGLMPILGIIFLWFMDFFQTFEKNEQLGSFKFKIGKTNKVLYYTAVTVQSH